jgi:hypothetical protein
MEWYWSIVRAVAPADWYWVGGVPLAAAIAAAAAAAVWFAWRMRWRLSKRQVRLPSLKIHYPKALTEFEDNFRKATSPLLGRATILLHNCGDGMKELRWLFRPVVSSITLAVAAGALGAPLWGWYMAGVIALAVGVGVALLWSVRWLWWLLPKNQANRLSINDNKARADVEDNFRKTIGQLLGGAAVLVGAGLAYLQFTQQQKASYEQFSQQQQASHDLLISNQVSKGFEQLGSDKVLVKLGGIYALEGVMNASEQYHRPVLEALCAFVRDGTRDDTKIGDRSPATEIQAALTVIGRRHLIEHEAVTVDLVGAHIHKANLNEGNFNGAKLTGADLSGANLLGADLSGADLSGANLEGAEMSELTPVYTTESDDFGGSTDFSLTKLNGANLRGANLSNAHLHSVELKGADLSGANLNHADLRFVNLHHANLEAADLSGSNLSHVDLRDLRGGPSQVQLDGACGTDATLPPGLTLKPCAPTK